MNDTVLINPAINFIRCHGIRCQNRESDNENQRENIIAIRIFVSFFEEIPSDLYHSSAVLPNNLEGLHAIIDFERMSWNFK